MSRPTLPAELRLEILGFVGKKSNYVAPYAAVCGEWQAFLEERTFKKLHVKSNEIDTLGATMQRGTQRRQFCLRELDLSIILPCHRPCRCLFYGCCINLVVVFTDTMQTLMMLLSKWDPAQFWMEGKHGRRIFFSFQLPNGGYQRLDVRKYVFGGSSISVVKYWHQLRYHLGHASIPTAEVVDSSIQNTIGTRFRLGNSPAVP